MATKQSDSNSEPGIFKTLKADFKSFFHTLFYGEVKRPAGRQFRELREFYLDQDRRKRLSSMGKIRRWFVTGFWLLKAMILKLSPVRRVLFVIGVLMLFDSNSSAESGSGSALPGGIILLVLLMFELKDKLLAKDELAAGHAVQKALLPPEKPQVPGWDIWLYYQAANDVGGDLLDFQHIDENRYGCALGDVSGKGLQAALLMAKLQATLHAFSPEPGSLTDLMARINRHSFREGLPASFASLIYLEFGEKTGSVRFVNAGHMPPLVISNSEVRELAKGEIALGLTEEARYTEQCADLDAGDVLVLYSDGVTEARNEAGEFYGEETLFALLRQGNGATTPEIGARIVKAVAEFVGPAPRTDDLSLAILRRAPEPVEPNSNAEESS